MLNLDALTYKLQIDDSDLPAATQRTERAFTQIGAAAAGAGGSAGMRQFRDVSKLTRQEMLALNYTMSDVAASLASGASPWTILAQQGGQVKDAFGGIGPLFSKLGSFVTAGNVLLLSSVAAVGSLATAWYTGAQQSEAFTKGMLRTGDSAGITRGQFEALAQVVADSTSSTIASSRKVLQALVDSGQVGPDALGAISRAAVTMARAFDMTETDATKSLLGMTSGVAKWAAEYNKSTNFITIEQYRTIAAMEKAGKVQEALVLTADLVRQANERVTRHLSPLQQAWNDVGREASRAWDAMLNVGRESTLEQKIEETRKRLEMARRAENDPPSIGPYGGPRKSGAERVAQLEKELLLLNRSKATQEAIALAAGRSAVATKQAIEEEQKKKDAARSVAAPRDSSYEDALRREQQIMDEAGAAATKYFNDEQAKIDKRNADYRSRVEQAGDLAEQMAEQTRLVNASMISDERERALAELAIDRDKFEKRIGLLNVSAEQEALVVGRAAAYYAARERQITEDLKPEWQRRLEAFQDSVSYMKKAGDDFRTSWIENGREAFADFVATGKLSVASLVDFIERRFAGMVFDRYLAAPFDALGAKIFGSFGSFSSGSADWFANVMGSIGLPGMAGGGYAAAGSLQRVNEQGPELLTMGGRDYLMMGSRGGRVTPAGETARRLDGGLTIQQHNVFQGGVSRNEVIAGMELATRAAVAEVANARRRGNPSFVR